VERRANHTGPWPVENKNLWGQSKKQARELKKKTQPEPQRNYFSQLDARHTRGKKEANARGDDWGIC